MRSTRLKLSRIATVPAICCGTPPLLQKNVIILTKIEAYVSLTRLDVQKKIKKVYKLRLTTLMNKSVMKEGYSACQSDVIKTLDVRQTLTQPSPPLGGHGDSDNVT